LAADLFNAHANDIEIIVASRYEPIAVLKITATHTEKEEISFQVKRLVQLGLF